MPETSPYESPATPSAPRPVPDGSWFLRVVLALHAGVLFVVGAVVVGSLLLGELTESSGVFSVVVIAWALVFPALASIGVAELKDRSWQARVQWSLLVVGLWFLLLFLLVTQVILESIAA